MSALKGVNLNRVAAAIEADAGQRLPGLREALAEAQAHVVGRVHTPEEMAARRGRPAGSKKAGAKQAVTIRYSPEVLSAFRASGPGWQARVDGALKDWLRTHTPT
jgi:uncharacterized protein (DUF4415 family)